MKKRSLSYSRLTDWTGSPGLGLDARVNADLGIPTPAYWLDGQHRSTGSDGMDVIHLTRLHAMRDS